jgi:hypothetical protein
MWALNKIHPIYGKVVAMGLRDGESYRMCLKDGVTSLIPLECMGLKELAEEITPDT